MEAAPNASQQDLVRYNRDSATYTRIFDGATEGLENGPLEDIDALHFFSNNHFIFSTVGGGNVPDVGFFGDEDLIEYDDGVFSMFFNGSDHGLDFGGEGEDINALHVINHTDQFEEFVFSVEGIPVSIPGVPGAQNEDLIHGKFNAITQTYDYSLFFDGDFNGDNTTFGHFLGGGNDPDESFDAIFLQGVVPEPTSCLLIVMGFAWLLLWRRR